MTASPAPTPTTKPLSTEATVGSVLSQITPSEGVAIKVSCCPTSNAKVVLFSASWTAEEVAEETEEDELADEAGLDELWTDEKEEFATEDSLLELAATELAAGVPHPVKHSKAPERIESIRRCFERMGKPPYSSKLLENVIIFALEQLLDLSVYL